MRHSMMVTIALMLVVTAAACAYEKSAYLIRDDFGTEPLYDCALSYYYSIPCPTYSWFWGYWGWTHGEIIGLHFTIGDIGTAGHDPCCPTSCHQLERIRVLDLAGYGTTYPGLFTVEFDVYCCDENGCPVGPSLWNSAPWETAPGWNELMIAPPGGLSICGCSIHPAPSASAPRALVTVTHTGTDASYPKWGMDNISKPLDESCRMHDYGCLPALYPRPSASHYPTMHTGYYGQGFACCPPLWFCDGCDTTPDCSQYGFIELAWRLYISCAGPTAQRPTAWSSIKSMYR